MRRAPWVALAIALLGCGAEAPRPDDPPIATAPSSATAAPESEPSALEPLIRKNVALAESAWATKSTEALAALYTPDAVFVTRGADGARQETTSEMVRGLAGFWRGMSAVKMATTRVIHAGDLAAAEWVVSGTTVGRDRVGVAGVSLMWFGPNGLVTREHLYMDEQTVGMQLGEKGIVGRAPISAPTETRWVGGAEDGASLGVAKALYAALEKNETAELGALFDKDAMHVDWSRADDARGPYPIADGFARIHAAFPDRTFTITRALSTRGHVVIEGAWSGSMKGALGTAPPTGRVATVHFVDIFEMAGSTITRLTTYANGVELAAAIAPTPAPPP
jgi:ketosteroid isomerase-like protein/predicted ester cyclase